MGPMQLLQGLWTLFLGILRMIALTISVIPGTKGMLKYLPWMNDKDFEEDPNAWKKGRRTLNEVMAEYRSSPEYIEQQRREHLTKAERIIEDNQVFTKKHFEQPHYVHYSYKVNGTPVSKAP